jgi:hypothetical protein
MAKKRRSSSRLKKKFSVSLKYLLPILLFTLLIPHYSYDFKSIPFHIDEHEFIRKTYYFDLFFLKRNFSDPRWYTQDAPQQPKLGPYIYGLTLHLLGISDIEETFKSIGFRNINVGETSWWWDWWSKPIINPPPELMPSFRLVWQGRKVSILFTLAALFLMFATTYKIKGLAFSLLSTYLLATNSLIFVYGSRAMTDSMQLFFFFTSLLLFMLFLKAFKRNHKNKVMLLSLGMGINCAFAVGVKVSGIMSLLFLVAMFLILFALRRSSKRSLHLLIQTLFIITLSFFVVFVFFHPYLYHHTFPRFISLFVDRLEEANQNRTLIPFFAVSTRWDAIRLITYRVFSSPGTTNFSFYDLPIDILLFIAGFLIIGKKAFDNLIKKKEISGEFILLVWTLVVILSLIYYLRIDWPRYYIPMVSVVTIVQSYAIIYLLHDLWLAKVKAKPKAKKA